MNSKMDSVCNSLSGIQNSIDLLTRKQIENDLHIKDICGKMSVANSLSSSQFMKPDSLFETQNHSVTFNQSEGLPLDMIRDMQRNMNALGGVQV